MDQKAYLAGYLEKSAARGDQLVKLLNLRKTKMPTETAELLSEMSGREQSLGATGAMRNALSKTDDHWGMSFEDTKAMDLIRSLKKGKLTPKVIENNNVKNIKEQAVKQGTSILKKVTPPDIKTGEKIPSVEEMREAIRQGNPELLGLRNLFEAFMLEHKGI